jgi:hypothetical protein
LILLGHYDSISLNSYAVGDGIHTVIILSSVHGTRTQTKEEHPIFLILGLELSSRHIHRSLADRVRCTLVESVLDSQFLVRHAGADGHDFPALSFQNERHEEIEQMDVPDDVRVKTVQEILSQAVGTFSAELGEGVVRGIVGDQGGVGDEVIEGSGGDG